LCGSFDSGAKRISEHSSLGLCEITALCAILNYFDTARLFDNYSTGIGEARITTVKNAMRYEKKATAVAVRQF
jgi:hypothetical protein